MARMAGARVEEGQEVVDTIRWLDRMLVSLCSRYGDCNENSSSHQFHLPQNFQRYPQLMYHLRRSRRPSPLTEYSITSLSPRV